MWYAWFVLLVSLWQTGNAAPPSEAASVAPPVSPIVSQLDLDGIRLGDEAGTVTELWGNPRGKEADAVQPSCETWFYSDGRSVGLCDGFVYFAQMTATVNDPTLLGREVSFENADLRRTLGNPDFVADDGWGVTRGEDAIKVFTDEEGEVVSLDLFTGPCGV